MELDLTKGRATDFPDIYSEMERNESPSPPFITDKEKTSHLALLPVHNLFPDANEGEFSLSETEYSIIPICDDSAASKSEIATALKLSPQSGTLKRLLPKLVAEGFPTYGHL